MKFKIFRFAAIIFLIFNSKAQAKELKMVAVLNKGDSEVRFKPLFVLENQEWRTFNWHDCPSVPKDWNAFPEKAGSIQLRVLKKPSEDCVLEAKPKMNTAKITFRDSQESILSITAGINKSANWRPFLINSEIRKKLGLNAKAQVKQSLKNKQGNMFVNVLDNTGVNDGPANIISGLWDSHFKKIWSSGLSFVNFIGDFEFKSGRSCFMLEEQEYGSMGWFSIFSEDLKVIASTKEP